MKLWVALLMWTSLQTPVPDESIPAVLLRNPRELPRAEAGAWSEWAPDQPMPQSHGARITAAARAYGRRELPVALDHMLGVLDELPDFPPLVHQSGVIYFKLRRYGDAQEMFERFVRVAPAQIEQTRALGHCYYSLGNYEDARSHYAKVLEKAPDMVEARRGLALSNMRLGDHETALRELGLVVEQDPTHADAWTWIAQIQYDQERLEEARAAIEEAQKIAPFDSRSWFLLAQVHYENGEDEEGDRAHERYSKLNAVAQEVRYLEARLAIDPHQPDVLRKLAQLHHSIGDQDSVRRVFALLIREDPKGIPIRIEILNELVTMNDSDGAKAAALSLEQVAGDDPIAWKKLETFWGRVGNRVKQVEAAEKYLRLKYK